MAVELDIRQLKMAVDAILDHIISDLKIERLLIEDGSDYYWEVPWDKLYSVKESSPELDVGRLADDLEFLRSVPGNKDQAVALMLVHVAPLLRHIGQIVGK